LLTNAKLPVKAPDTMSYQDFFKIMIHDKKVKNGSIRYVLPTGFGKSAVFSDVPEELVVRAIEG
jgi:3-dehydroquinate synthase